MTNKTQNVLNHLKIKRSITSWEAIELYKATRLSSIIFRLRDKGHKIISKWEEKIDCNGNKERYVRYIYLGESYEPIKERIRDWIIDGRLKK